MKQWKEIKGRRDRIIDRKTENQEEDRGRIRQKEVPDIGHLCEDVPAINYYSQRKAKGEAPWRQFYTVEEEPYINLEPSATKPAGPINYHL